MAFCFDLQNVYLGEEVAEEPDFEYVPESSDMTGDSAATGISSSNGHHHGYLTTGGKCVVSSSAVVSGGQRALLSQSMMLLEESLASGAIVGQFEQLYRRYDTH